MTEPLNRKLSHIARKPGANEAFCFCFWLIYCLWPR